MAALNLRFVTELETLRIDSSEFTIQVGDILKNYLEMETHHAHDFIIEKRIYDRPFSSVKIVRKVEEFAAQFFDEQDREISAFSFRYYGNDSIKITFWDRPNFHYVTFYFHLAGEVKVAAPAKIVIDYADREITVVES